MHKAVELHFLTELNASAMLEVQGLYNLLASLKKVFDAQLKKGSSWKELKKINTQIKDVERLINRREVQKTTESSAVVNK